MILPPVTPRGRGGVEAAQKVRRVDAAEYCGAQEARVVEMLQRYVTSLAVVPSLQRRRGSYDTLSTSEVRCAEGGVVGDDEEGDAEILWKKHEEAEGSDVTDSKRG